MFGWIIYSEIRIKYFLKFNGLVIGKKEVAPKKLPELIVAGNTETFPLWKWKGIDYDSVRIGDSIVKTTSAPKAYYYKRDANKSFTKITLEYWSE